ncbi:MAG TPA: acyl-CoA dehydrogenase family protein, partial [Microthrixaceae bacterium]|nr:acyl-CoA dehydrogenase family protein [Microthrixaceae bacterium]
MITELSDVATEFGDSARKAIAAEGGDELVQRAEAEPEARAELVEPLLRGLGVPDLDPRRSDDELEAAAALCRSAGYWSIAFPLAEVLSRPADLEVNGLVVIDDIRPAAALGGLGGRWAAVTLDGRLAVARPRPLDVGPRKSAFVTELDLESTTTPASPVDVALALVLPMWTLLGMIDRALDLTRAYVLDREQFGQPLAKFQGVQFQLTDAEV